MPGLNTISLGADAASIYDMLSAHPMPLVRGARVPAALDLIEKQTPDALFPNSFSPALAAAGLWLAAGNWKRAHEISQDVATPEGAYWHAIVHRQEPDAGNAKYWFRQVGEHPVFAMLSEFTGGPWDPARFVDVCVGATGTPSETAVREVQHFEWRSLLSYCARSKHS